MLDLLDELDEVSVFQAKELTLRMTPYQVNFMYLLLKTFVAEHPEIFPHDDENELYANNDQIMIEGLMIYLQHIFLEKEI